MIKPEMYFLFQSFKYIKKTIEQYTFSKVNVQQLIIKAYSKICDCYISAKYLNVDLTGRCETGP